ncbi:hypothetical protein ACFU98_37150 [Streptomyces sp. NPDC057575]
MTTNRGPPEGRRLVTENPHSPGPPPDERDATETALAVFRAPIRTDL